MGIAAVMILSDLIRLIALSMIWGGSFLFMRIAAPEFGPFALVMLRTAGGALVLAPFLFARRHRETIRRHAFDFFILGLTASAIPWCLLAYATLSLEAGFTSLLNATTPMFTAIIGAVWFASRIRSLQVVGLIIAFVGVGLLSQDRLSFKEGGDGWAILAGLAAPVLYGVACNLTSSRLKGVPAPVVSAGNTMCAAIVLLPVGLWHWPDKMPSLTAWMCAAALAFLCTAVAFLLFFKIINRCSPMAASSVTFLIPVSAIFWGWLVLGEPVSFHLLAGMMVTFAGTALAIQLLPFKRSEKQEASSGDD
jgi:drug/metabolite transporter (DMT)-like permease